MGCPWLCWAQSHHMGWDCTRLCHSKASRNLCHNATQKSATRPASPLTQQMPAMAMGMGYWSVSSSKSPPQGQHQTAPE